MNLKRGVLFPERLHVLDVRRRHIGLVASYQHVVVIVQHARPRPIKRTRDDHGIVRLTVDDGKFMMHHPALIRIVRVRVASYVYFPRLAELSNIRTERVHVVRVRDDSHPNPTFRRALNRSLNIIARNRKAHHVQRRRRLVQRSYEFHQRRRVVRLVAVRLRAPIIRIQHASTRHDGVGEY